MPKPDSFHRFCSSGYSIPTFTLRDTHNHPKENVNLIKPEGRHLKETQIHITFQAPIKVLSHRSRNIHKQQAKA